MRANIFFPAGPSESLGNEKWHFRAAYFVAEFSACQARSAKREEGEYFFVMVFAVCGGRSLVFPLSSKNPGKDAETLYIPILSLLFFNKKNG